MAACIYCEAAMGKMNTDWHEAHVMPRNATETERAAWHYEHALNCGCRAITPSIAALLKANGYDVPEPLRGDRSA